MYNSSVDPSFIRYLRLIRPLCQLVVPHFGGKQIIILKGLSSSRIEERLETGTWQSFLGLEGNLLGLVASYRIPIYRMALKNARRGILKSVEKPKWRSSRTPSFKGLNYTISVNENTCLRPNARGIKLKFRVFILEP